MAQFTMTIPDGLVNELLDAFAEVEGIPVDESTGEPTMTKADFAKSQIRNYIRSIYRRYKRREAEDSVGDTIDTAQTDADTASDPITVA